MRTPTPVIIDCDPGVDDAFCLALALASPELEVIGVTTVAGNAAIGPVTANARGVLAACGRPDIPVAAGAVRALVHAYDHGLPPPHGENGVGGALLGESPVAADPRHAVYLLRDLLAASAPRSVTILATAPLTNLALLCALHPDLLVRIDRLIVMGGSAGRGNITPAAEFNTWTDPEAAQRVLSEPALDVCLVGLDVTRRATLTPTELDVLAKRSRLGALLAEMVRGYRDRTDLGWAIHDALTVAALLEPSLLRTATATVEVDTGTGPGRGQTLCRFLDAGRGPEVAVSRYATAGQVELATDLDVDQFRRLIMDRVAWPRPAGADQPVG